MDNYLLGLKSKSKELQEKINEIREEYKDELVLITESIVFLVIVWDLGKRIKAYFSKEECYI